MTALVILAAGKSSRLGQPKQNLMFQGQTLLQGALMTARQSNCEPVFVVLGANADHIELAPGTHILFNKDWSEGMASSIRMAINELEKFPAVANVIIMLCDQPFVTAALLNEMIGIQVKTGKQIVACTYNGTIGVPALFDRALFTELLQVQGSEGAKKLFKAYPLQVGVVPFEQGSVDIDTPFDYEGLVGKL